MTVAAANASSEREALLRERKKMLDAVGAYMSEELASAVGSKTGNASQFAADQRRTSKLFGVRFGQSWLYPKFQFDAKRQTLSEMKSVLSALSPDDQSWDRLQWFLQPHEALRGGAPLEVWKTSPTLGATGVRHSPPHHHDAQKHAGTLPRHRYGSPGG